MREHMSITGDPSDFEGKPQSMSTMPVEEDESHLIASVDGYGSVPVDSPSARRSRIYVNEQERHQNNDGNVFDDNRGETKAKAGRSLEMIRIVIGEIKEKLVEQGHDVGDTFDDAENWRKLIEQHGGGLAESVHTNRQKQDNSPIREVLVTKSTTPCADRDGIDIDVDIETGSVCSDVTGDFGELGINGAEQAEQFDQNKNRMADSLVGEKFLIPDGSEPTSPSSMTSPTPKTKSKRNKKDPLGKSSSHSARSSKSRARKKMRRRNSSHSLGVGDISEELFPGAREYMNDSMAYSSSFQCRTSPHRGGAKQEPCGNEDTPPEETLTSPRTRRRGRRRNLPRHASLMQVCVEDFADSSPVVATPPAVTAQKTGVRFDQVVIRHYERIISDNPACSGGPPIGIGWSYNKKDTTQWGVEEFELLRGTRRTSRELILRRDEREALLRGLGYTDRDIVAAKRKLRISQNQRKRTVDNLDLGAEKFEAVVESAVRKTKRLFKLEKRTSSFSSVSSSQSAIMSGSGHSTNSVPPLNLRLMNSVIQ